MTESQLRLVLERRGGLGMIPGADEHLDECELCRAVVAGLAQDASTSEERTDCSHGNAKEEALSRSLSIGAVIADRYVVLEVIGIGGMGIVYAAYDRRLDRKIALKMLRPSISAQDRLVKEAQNLARLSHPNVVVVHDVGQFMGQTYMAMEYVDGLNLRKWKEIERPSAERILDVYLKAARGLAAAHAAGLVHRDVKPENIVLGHDDRVRVVDFGLADVEHPGEDEAGVTGSAGASHGKLEGTALYMAPELYRGQVADARSDQFGFCVALHEALFGQHPFRFTRLQELSEAMQLGHFRELPRDRRVDRALRAVLLRGLSADPAARYESVDALCKALQHAMQRKRRRIIAAISVFCTVLVCAALVALGRTPTPSPPCADSERLLADIWNASKREQLARVFGETKLVYADSAATTVNTALDRFAKRWTDAHAETCRATRVYHEQSEEVMDLRMACLDRRRIEFRIMTERLLTPNAATVEKAAEAAHLLPSPEWCDKAHVQSEQVPPPNADVAEQVRALQLRLASVETMIRLGHEVEAFQMANQLAEEAEKLQYAPLQAEV
ncbi:MAG TPA: serine/threonine-protein kinase, partial [Polyangium sp.]|nr:serine/threonine-protein kinase [Polyangium sp.]